MADVESFLKSPKAKRSKGRARPDEPLSSWCEFGTPVCTGRAEVRHHRLPRSDPRSTDSADNTADVCDACHRHAHAHPAESYARGWLRRRPA